MSKCCICKRDADAENAPILIMSAYGIPRYICPDCEKTIDITKESTDPWEITEACQALGESLTAGDTGDTAVIDTVNTIIKEAHERSEAIKHGSYLPKEMNEEVSEDEDFEITEELLETEEDREKDQKDAKVGKIVDTVISWAAGLAFLAAVIIFIIEFVA